MTKSQADYSQICITEARPEEFPLAAEILDDASRRLLAVGIVQWPIPFPVERLVFAGSGATVYLAWDGQVAAGTFTLQPRDAAFWPEAVEAAGGLGAWGTDGTRPVYLHRFATRSGYRGLGAAMLALAESMARSLGANLMRLDCVSSDAKIRAYYESFGYDFRGDIQPSHLTFPAAKYEKGL